MNKVTAANTVMMMGMCCQAVCMMMDTVGFVVHYDT